MHDTAPEVEAKLRALFRARSPAQRVRMATEMYGMVTRLMLAGLQSQQPHRDAFALRLALLERLHGDQLTPAAREAVAAHLRRKSGTTSARHEY
jgi:hypothetical protein